ncbi:GMC oxidoreductase [Candidatus Pelagibacter sp.]|uniref:GMC oxidoreductase n=1 Tax=Candidatus Pelagibacter sp. TaxID=2024849 RepID=UPI003F8399CF
MLIDLKIKEERKRLSKIDFTHYDYVVVGTGPSGVVLIDTLLKKQKKILVIEKGNFIDKIYESVISKNIKIKKKSKTFAVGGTSLDWSQVYSYLDDVELNYRSKSKKKNIWPFSYLELINYYKKLDKKFKFDFKQLKKENFNFPFLYRKFTGPARPCNFGKLLNLKKIDLIYNCTLKTIDNKNKSIQLFLQNKNYKKTINVKNLILCNGGIESTSLILRSLKDKKIKKLKNKNYVGKFFMDHPKGYVGVLKYPKQNLIEKIELKTNKDMISYYGLSLTKKEQNLNKLLNTYVRFEKVSMRRSIIDPVIKSINNFTKNFRFEKSNININNDYYNIRVFFEMCPTIRNEIKINEKGKTEIDFKYSKKEIKTLNILIKKIFNFFSEKSDFENIKFYSKNSKLTFSDASHHIGGLVYPKLVNKNLKFHGLDGVYCCSSSIFPISGSVNPTFTLCALALRLGSFLD